MKHKLRHFALFGAGAFLAVARLFAGDPIYVIDGDGNGSEAVTLSGAASNDPDGALIDYQWSVNGAVVSSGYGPIVADLRFTFALGTTTVSLSVRDDVQLAHSDTSNVIVFPQSSNLPPVARAVVPSTAAAPGSISARIFVDASSSSDPDNDAIVRYKWTEGSITHYDGSVSTATITLKGTGAHSLTLTVYSTDRYHITQSGSRNFVVDVFASPLDPAFLAQRRWNLRLGKDFAFSNIYEDYAGITFNPLTQTYFMTENQEDVIIEIKPDGTLVRTINIHDVRRTGELETDAEGITWMYDQTYALVLEGGEEMVVLQINPGTSVITRSDVTVYDLSGDPKGVAYSQAEDALYWVSQAGPMRLVKTRINPLLHRLETIFNLDLTGLPASDLADVALAPELSPNIFLVSQSTPVVMELDLSGSSPYLVSAFSISPWPIPKPGGIMFNQNREMVIVGKHAAGKPENDLNIFTSIDSVAQAPVNYPVQPANSPADSLNYIHPGSTQHAEFFVDLHQTGSAEIQIYDQTGRQVHKFRTPELAAGQYRAPWDLKNEDGDLVSSGMYFVLIKTPDGSRKEKLVVVR